MTTTRSRRTALMLVATALLLLPAAALAQFSFARIPWRHLSFEGSKFGISLHADLGIELVPAGRLFEVLLPSEQTPGISPAGEQVLRVVLHSEVLGRRSEIELWVEPENAAAFQRVQTESGKKQRVKSARYGEEGITSVRHRPRKGTGEEERPPEQWTDIRREFERYPSWAGRNLRVSDPTALFYVVAAAALEKPGDLAQIRLYSDDDLLLVEARVLERVRVEVDYETIGAGGTQRRKQSVDALRLALGARALGPGASEKSFELAGMRGDVEMLLDPRSRLPLELSGRVPYAGRVAIRLKSVSER